MQDMNMSYFESYDKVSNFSNGKVNFLNLFQTCSKSLPNVSTPCCPILQHFSMFIFVVIMATLSCYYSYDMESSKTLSSGLNKIFININPIVFSKNMIKNKKQQQSLPKSSDAPTEVSYLLTKSGMQGTYKPL